MAEESSRESKHHSMNSISDRLRTVKNMVSRKDLSVTNCLRFFVSLNLSLLFCFESRFGIYDL